MTQVKSIQSYLARDCGEWSKRLFHLIVKLAVPFPVPRRDGCEHRLWRVKGPLVEKCPRHDLLECLQRL